MSRFQPGFLYPHAIDLDLDAAYVASGVAQFLDSGGNGIGAVSNISVGATAADRKCVFVLSFELDVDLASVDVLTTGSVLIATATRIAQARNVVASPNLCAEIWYADLPTETVVTLGLTMTGLVGGFPTGRCSVYRATGVTNIAADSDAQTSNTAALTSIVDVGDDGFVIAGHARAIDTQTVTWAGVTENDDTDAGALRHSAASAAFVAGQTGLNVTGTGSAAGECAQAVVVLI